VKCYPLYVIWGNRIAQLLRICIIYSLEHSMSITLEEENEPKCTYCTYKFYAASYIAYIFIHYLHHIHESSPIITIIKKYVMIDFPISVPVYVYIFVILRWILQNYYSRIEDFFGIHLSRLDFSANFRKRRYHNYSKNKRNSSTHLEYVR